MTTEITTPTVDTKASLDRLEHLCAHLEHMLAEGLDRIEEASILCEGEAKDKAQRAGASRSQATRSSRTPPTAALKPSTAPAAL